MYVETIPTHSQKLPSRLGITTEPWRCPLSRLSRCGVLMMRLCSARSDLRRVTMDGRNKQRELEIERSTFRRWKCDHSRLPNDVKRACKRKGRKIALLERERSNLESKRIRLRNIFWNLRDQYVQTCGSIPTRFQKAKRVTLRKGHCRWSQPC